MALLRKEANVKQYVPLKLGKRGLRPGPRTSEGSRFNTNTLYIFGKESTVSVLLGIQYSVLASKQQLS